MRSWLRWRGAWWGSQTRQVLHITHAFFLHDWQSCPGLTPTSKLKRAKSIDIDLDDSDDKVRLIQLLQSKLIQWPGYSMFKASAHKTLQNPDINQNWEFTTKFCDDFYGKNTNSVSFSFISFFFFMKLTMFFGRTYALQRPWSMLPWMVSETIYMSCHTLALPR